jgi:hypothetical protein
MKLRAKGRVSENTSLSGSWVNRTNPRARRNAYALHGSPLRFFASHLSDCMEYSACMGVLRLHGGTKDRQSICLLCNPCTDKSRVPGRHPVVVLMHLSDNCRDNADPPPIIAPQRTASICRTTSATGKRASPAPGSPRVHRCYPAPRRHLHRILAALAWLLVQAPSVPIRR